MYSMKSVIAQKGIYNVIKYHLVQQLPQMSYPGDYLYSVLHFRKSGLPQVTQSKQITDLDATLFFITTPLCLQNIPIRRWISCLKGITYSSLQTEMHACQGSSVVSDSLRPQGLQPARLLCPWGFSRQEYCSELPCPPPGDLPDLQLLPHCNYPSRCLPREWTEALLFLPPHPRSLGWKLGHAE